MEIKNSKNSSNYIVLGGSYLMSAQYDDPPGDHQRPGQEQHGLASHPVHQPSRGHGHGEVSDVNERYHPRHLAFRQRHGRQPGVYVLYDRRRPPEHDARHEHRQRPCKRRDSLLVGSGLAGAISCVGAGRLSASKKKKKIFINQ